jgi:putative MATE family efflux protein
MSQGLAVPSLETPKAARTRLLLEGPILATLLRLSAPNILNLLAIAALITIDGFFVARLGDNALAGVSMVFPFIMFVQHVSASGMGGAVSSAVARSLGAGLRERADAVASHALLLSIGMGLLFSVVMLAAGPLFFQWMGGRGEALEAARQYSTVAFAGIFSVVLLNILANIVRGTGNMFFPAAVLLAAMLLHAVLAPVLIFGWGRHQGLGPAGAAWSLVACFTIGSGALLAYLRSTRSLVRLSFAGTPYEWPLLREILRVGVPGMLNVAITNLTVVVLTGVAARLGRDVAIGYAIGARLEYIMIPIAFGFGTALVALIGTNWGAKQFERSRRIAWVGGATVALACGVVGLLFALFPELWMGLFTNDEKVARVGALYLRTAASVYALYGLAMAFFFAMQGVGNLMPAVMANALRLVVSAGGATLLVTRFGGNAADVFIAIAVGFALFGIVNSLLLARAMREPLSPRASWFRAGQEVAR